MRGQIRFRDEGPEIEDFKTEVIENLSRERKTLPCKFFYDRTGSALFDRICELDEYYPTRTEISLLERHGGSSPNSAVRTATSSSSAADRA